MIYKTLVDCQTLARHIPDGRWIIVDCRFRLADTTAGYQAYLESHIPGAVYIHLDDDLSGPPITDVGRHPLPTPAALTALFGRLGIGYGMQVVAYDDVNGMVASRLWWMLRYMGHEQVAILDGGWSAWQEAGLPVRNGLEKNDLTLFTGAPNHEWLVRMDEVEKLPLLIDSRDPARYRGEIEPLDPIAGHIPQAKNYFYQQNWTENGYYLPVEQIHQQLQKVIGNTLPDDVTFYCGSGVSACVNLLAMAHAGLGNGRLYVGSWSEWSRRGQPIATKS